MSTQTKILSSHLHNTSSIIPIYQPSDQNTFNSNFIRLTQQRWELNGLYQSLATLIGHDSALDQMFLYNIGTSKWNRGSTIFWQQQDNSPNIYTGGLISKFDPQSGLAIDGRFTTVQETLVDLYGIDLEKPPVPNLIGNHLVSAYPSQPVIICHNPITALVGSHLLNHCTWLATPDHPLVDLTGPSFVRALPTSASILLIAEPGQEENWSRAHYVLSSFLSVDPNRRIDLLIAADLPDFESSVAKWMANDSFSANWIIGLALGVSAKRKSETLTV